MQDRTTIHRNDFEFQADWIDATCDAFEAAWRSSEPPVLSDFLQDCLPDDLFDLFEQLLMVDVECRRDAGKPLTCEQYLNTYPKFASVIQAVDFASDIDRLTDSPVEFAEPKPREMGDRIGQFELLEKLGEGSEGQVWRARDSKLLRDVALKLPVQGRYSHEDLQRSLGEGRALGQLNHPNIVRVYDIGRSGGTTYIVSDFIDAGSLRDALDENAFSSSSAVRVCLDLSMALQHAHGRGVIHRDLKPANVMLDQSGKALVTDFGLSKSRIATDEGTQRKIVGTPAYMSPEQTGKSEWNIVDARSDIYSLGVILYELLTSVRPHSQSFPEVIRAIVEDVPESPRQLNGSVPRELQAICLKCLRKSPEDRYQTAEELALDLRRYQRGEPVAALPISRTAAARKWVVRRPAIASAIALAVIAVIALFVSARVTNENRALLGLRPVLIETLPSGASITIVPRDSAGEPISSAAIRLRKKTPTRLDLAPGDYLVEAVLPDGRFHEVFRRVPATDAPMPDGPFDHLFWEEDESGRVQFPLIDIPEKDATSNMAMVSASLDPKGSSNGTDFFIDRNEFQVRDLIRSGFDMRGISKNSSANTVVSASYDEAVYLAEKIGMRLPTKEELLRAIQYSENEAPGKSVPIHHLRDGVAEWTSSSLTTGFPGLAKSKEFEPFAQQYRVIVGGGEFFTQDESVMANILHGDGIHRGAKRYAFFEGLGFRCVKSARPRFSTTD